MSTSFCVQGTTYSPFPSAALKLHLACERPLENLENAHVLFGRPKWPARGHSIPAPAHAIRQGPIPAHRQPISLSHRRTTHPSHIQLISLDVPPSLSSLSLPPWTWIGGCSLAFPSTPATRSPLSAGYQEPRTSQLTHSTGSSEEGRTSLRVSAPRSSSYHHHDGWVARTTARPVHHVIQSM